jgi:hypothetical protein
LLHVGWQLHENHKNRKIKFSREINIMSNLYKIICIGTSLLFVFLFAQLFFTPLAFVEDLGLQATLSTSVLAQRASIFMLGLAVLLFGARKLQHSPVRQTICLSAAITLTGLACLSTFEMIRGTVNDSIWFAFIIETICSVLFWIVFVKNLGAKPIVIYNSNEN